MEAELFDHYVARGAEPWNTSLEAAWLDYALRAWVAPRLPRRPGARIANIGVGVGLWDDWLAYEVGAPITSIEIDPAIRRVFAARQRRERHPYPSRVLAALPAHERFDAITIVGSTLAETAERAALEAAARAATDCLLVAEVGNREPPPVADTIERLGEIWIAFRRIAA